MVAIPTVVRWILCGFDLRFLGGQNGEQFFIWSRCYFMKRKRRLNKAKNLKMETET
jgi:hypothetical protein